MRAIRTSGLMSGIWKRSLSVPPRQISTLQLKIVLVLVVVLVLDLLGLCVETGPESSRTISFHRNGATLRSAMGRRQRPIGRGR
jgi:hypothetical protein